MRALVFPSQPGRLNARVDLIGDFVVLFCWRWSRRPPSARYPHGFGKFESLGSLVVAVLLGLGGLGIGAQVASSYTRTVAHHIRVAGLHSYHLLLETLRSMRASTSHGVPGYTRVVTPPAPHAHGHGHGHAHAHDVVDPNAAWFALGSIVVKEWLYRISAADAAGLY